MRTVSSEELIEIRRLHGMWRRGEAGGARADLAGADLADADLARANLARANLAGADLAGAYLADADLGGANLARANLAGANLADAYLADAYLGGANLADANLAGADLAGADLAGADLGGANLARAYLADADLGGAYLGGANLADAKNVPPIDPEQTAAVLPAGASRAAVLAERASKYRKRHPEVPVVEHLDARILRAVTLEGGTLDMSVWHSTSCKTTHCRAGWAITLAGDAGRDLETKHGPERAGTMIYRASTGRVPYFFARTDVALADIKCCAAEQGEVTGS